jgi:hypothetical protein
MAGFAGELGGNDLNPRSVGCIFCIKKNAFSLFFIFRLVIPKLKDGQMGSSRGLFESLLAATI